MVLLIGGGLFILSYLCLLLEELKLLLLVYYNVDEYIFDIFGVILLEGWNFWLEEVVIGSDFDGYGFNIVIVF